MYNPNLELNQMYAEKLTKNRFNDMPTFEQINHALELLQAESEGRLVIRPCKVGDTLWYLQEQYRGETIAKPCTVSSFQMDKWNRIYCIEERQNTKMFYFNDIGKTVFLDEQQAKEALGNESSIN